MNVLLGVCGGIAAYKSADLVRELQRHGIQVEVALTESAARFVTPLTFAALTGKPVHTSLWQQDAQSQQDVEIAHIAVARRIGALVVAPATADTLARLAHGRASDFLTACALVSRAPLILAPAMNVLMWEHPATQANLALLQQRGAIVVPPEDGYLACGMTGSGRLASIEAIAQAVHSSLHPRHDLAGKTVLITAGGTREPIDPVRFLGNRSSGKMGHALAEEAAARGARVLLITASPLPDPAGCIVTRVATAAQMAQAVFAALPQAQLAIMAAAVSDFRMEAVAPHKLRRSGPLTLQLVPTPDIAAQVAQKRNPGTFLLVFAAETHDLEAGARAKLHHKQADAVFANDVSSPETGFESDRNAGLFLTPDKALPIAPAPKSEVARQIFDAILKV